MKRSSWLETIASSMDGDPSIDADSRAELAGLDEVLFDAWNLGENIILAWTGNAAVRRFLVIRHYGILEPFREIDFSLPGNGSSAEFTAELLARPKLASPAEFDALQTGFGDAAHVIEVPVRPGSPLEPELVSGLVRRYSVSLVRERAVMLLDIVGFSLHPPLEQVAMLNSLSYSVNSAYRQLISEDVQINFARSSTGDGFYIWNRARTLDANIALYKLMMLILADNAVARTKARRFPVPQLRAAFHVGEHYEFCQVEALNPTTFSYIVGHVTIELSRIVEKALPGQILLGDFTLSMPGTGGMPSQTCDTVEFMARTEQTLRQLDGLAVAKDRIAGIRCYITGRSTPYGGFEASRYLISDKHGLQRPVYNAKINIHLQEGEPIFLGLQHKDLRETHATAAAS
jgi:class 3 adenylate cyclase